MLKLICEDVENIFIFEINIPITIQEKELFVIESWQDELGIEDRYVSLPKKSTQFVMNQYSQTLNEIIETAVIPSLQKCLLSYDNFHIQPCNTGKLFYNGKCMKTKDTLSYSSYFTIYADTNFINCSSKVHESINTFKIRLANHISPIEKIILTGTDSIALFSQELIGLYEQKFIEYTNNILTAYDIFLRSLSNYTNAIETFEDIDVQDIKELKKFAVQGHK